MFQERDYRRSKHANSCLLHMFHHPFLPCDMYPVSIAQYLANVIQVGKECLRDTFAIN